MAKRRIHLTESQLYGLVEQALNELDWRTYDNALKDVDKRLYDFHGGGWAYDNLWRKYLKRALQKKIGKEATDRAFRNLRDEWGNDDLYELLSKLFKDEIIADLKKQRSDLANARTQAFADRHGHDRTDYTGYDENGNPESYYDKDFDKLVPRDYMTVDSHGNYYDLENGSIDMKNGVIGTAASGTDYPTEFGWKSERAKTGWETYDRTAETGEDEDNTWALKGDDEGYSKKFPRTAAAEELAAKKSGRARYNRGKGWANESIAHRVTESVMRKLRRGRVNEANGAPNRPSDSLHLNWYEWTQMVLRKLKKLLVGKNVIFRKTVYGRDNRPRGENRMCRITSISIDNGTEMTNTDYCFNIWMINSDNGEKELTPMGEMRMACLLERGWGEGDWGDIKLVDGAESLPQEEAQEMIAELGGTEWMQYCADYNHIQ